MIYIDRFEIHPIIPNTGEEAEITVIYHEEYEGAKRYPNKYPYRYGEKKGD